jgi:hypothetical protein
MNIMGYTIYGTKIDRPVSPRDFLLARLCY